MDELIYRMRFKVLSVVFASLFIISTGWCQALGSGPHPHLLPETPLAEKAFGVSPESNHATTISLGLALIVFAALAAAVAWKLGSTEKAG